MGRLYDIDLYIKIIGSVSLEMWIKLGLIYESMDYVSSSFRHLFPDGTVIMTHLEVLPFRKGDYFIQRGCINVSIKNGILYK